MIPNLVDAIELQAKAKSDCPGRQTVGKIPGSRGAKPSRGLFRDGAGQLVRKTFEDGCEFLTKGGRRA